MSDLQKQMIEFSTMDLVKSVAESRKLSLPEAMEIVYKSRFFKKLQDPETGLYRESKAYLIRRFNQEISNRKPKDRPSSRRAGDPNHAPREPKTSC